MESSRKRGKKMSTTLESTETLAVNSEIFI